MSRLTRRLATLLASVLYLSPLGAQHRPPDGWAWQLDRSAPNVMGRDAPAGAWQFQEMIPGMHVTSGPGVTLFPRGLTAKGRYMVDADIVLFPNSSANGYGLVFGGTASSDSTIASRNALLLNSSGQFSIVRNAAGKLERLRDWTRHDAIVPRGTEPITNRLRVWAERDSVRFLVNGKPITSVPRALLESDGIFGLRFEEGINVHVTNVDHNVRLLKR